METTVGFNCIPRFQMTQLVLGLTVAGVVVMVTAIIGAAGYWIDKIAERHDQTQKRHNP